VRDENREISPLEREEGYGGKVQQTLWCRLQCRS